MSVNSSPPHKLSKFKFSKRVDTPNVFFLCALEQPHAAKISKKSGRIPNSLSYTRLQKVALFIDSNIVYYHRLYVTLDASKYRKYSTSYAKKIDDLFELTLKVSESQTNIN